MKIANRKIGKESFPLVIAELGINHGGDLELAKKWLMLPLSLVAKQLNIKLIL